MDCLSPRVVSAHCSSPLLGSDLNAMYAAAQAPNVPASASVIRLSAFALEGFSPASTWRLARSRNARASFRESAAPYSKACKSASLRLDAPGSYWPIVRVWRLPSKR